MNEVWLTYGSEILYDRLYDMLYNYKKTTSINLKTFSKTIK